MVMHSKAEMLGPGSSGQHGRALACIGQVKKDISLGDQAERTTWRLRMRLWRRPARGMLLGC